MTSKDASKRKICGNLENSGVCLFCDKFSDRRILERLSDIHWTEQIQRKSCLLASLLLTSLSVWQQQHTHLQTHTHTHTHTYRNIWTTANQKGGLPFTISDWFRPRYEPNVSVVEQQRDFLSRGDFFFFFCEWLDAPVRLKFFFSRTLEKLGRTCDQIGRTLEPCTWELNPQRFALLTQCSTTEPQEHYILSLPISSHQLHSCKLVNSWECHDFFCFNLQGHPLTALQWNIFSGKALLKYKITTIY